MFKLMNIFKITSSLLSISLMTALTACQEQVPSPVDAVSTDTEIISSQKVSGTPVRFGVLAIDSAVSVNERYSPLLNYLSESIGRPFELVTLSQESQFTKVAENNLDFTTNNPLAAMQIQRLHDTNFLVTHSRPNTGPQFSGLIIVAQNSDIKTIENLKNKRGACVDFETAAAGCIFQIYHLQQKGIDPFRDFSSFVENKSQDNIVFAVLNGTIDVGFIRTGQLEKMVDKGLLSGVDEVRILDPAKDGFYYKHTTELYPEWPIAALANTDPELTKAVEQALLNIPPNHPALQALKIDSFIPAVDYSQINQLIEQLKLRSWDAS